MLGFRGDHEVGPPPSSEPALPSEAKYHAETNEATPKCRLRFGWHLQSQGPRYEKA